MTIGGEGRRERNDRPHTDQGRGEEGRGEEQENEGKDKIREISCFWDLLCAPVLPFVRSVSLCEQKIKTRPHKDEGKGTAKQSSRDSNRPSFLLYPSSLPLTERLCS